MKIGPGLRWPILAFGALVLLSSGGMAWLILYAGIIPARESKSVANGVESIPEKSIAVLPFRKSERRQTNAFFADGVQDEILTIWPRLPT